MKKRLIVSLLAVIMLLASALPAYADGVTLTTVGRNMTVNVGEGASLRLCISLDHTAERLASIPNGAIVYVYGTTVDVYDARTWAKVNFSGITGWVNYAYLAPEAGGITLDPVNTYMTVSSGEGSMLRLCVEPDHISEDAANMPDGSEVFVFGVTMQHYDDRIWARCSYNGIVGWTNVAFLTEKEHGWAIVPGGANDGEEAYRCALCGETKSAPAAILENGMTVQHRPELCGTVPAGCTESGYTGDYVCAVCGKTLEYGQSTQPVGHKMRDEVVAPGCAEAGYTKHICTVCGFTTRDTETPPKGHSMKYGRCTVCGYADNPFVDVGEAYFTDAVLWAVSEKITQGMDATHFAPHEVCTRAQTVTFLWREAGQPEPETTSCAFADVSENDYFYKAVVWASEKGIVSGFDDGSFRPKDTVTRAQFVTFLWRSMGQPLCMEEKEFSDVEPGVYRDAILWAAESGITSGYSDGSFKPYAACTRAHVMSFMYRAFAQNSLHNA